MVILAAKDFLKKIESFFRVLLTKDFVVFTLLGVIHGFTNLGGSILSMKIFMIDYDKDKKRVTMAMAYSLLAIIQLSVIFFTQPSFSFDPKFFLLGIITFFLTEQFIFKRLSLRIFDKLFSYIILIFGLSLLSKDFL